MAIEIQSTECFFQTHQTMKSDSVALCLHQTTTQIAKQGFNKVIYFLDQNPTHKNLMKYNLALLPALPIDIVFIYIPPYSPKLNIVEFLIHLIREKKLHHAPHQQKIKHVAEELTRYLHQQKAFPKHQIDAILQHIAQSI